MAGALRRDSPRRRSFAIGAAAVGHDDPSRFVGIGFDDRFAVRDRFAIGHAGIDVMAFSAAAAGATTAASSSGLEPTGDFRSTAYFGAAVGLVPATALATAAAAFAAAARVATAVVAKAPDRLHPSVQRPATATRLAVVIAAAVAGIVTGFVNPGVDIDLSTARAASVRQHRPTASGHQQSTDQQRQCGDSVQHGAHRFVPLPRAGVFPGIREESADALSGEARCVSPTYALDRPSPPANFNQSSESLNSKESDRGPGGNLGGSRCVYILTAPLAAASALDLRRLWLATGGIGIIIPLPAPMPLACGEHCIAACPGR